jgi:hypothetical protein
MPQTPDVLDNTPWWLPDVTMTGAAGLVVQRCSAYEQRAGAGPRHLEGGFYDLASLGPHIWVCKARSDGRFRMECVHGHRGQPQHLCNGHVAMIRRRGSGVCPPCVHPPAEIEIQEAMNRVRSDPVLYTGSMAERNQAAGKALSKLMVLQERLDELVARGIVHRCPLTLTEMS